MPDEVRRALVLLDMQAMGIEPNADDLARIDREIAEIFTLLGTVRSYAGCNALSGMREVPQ